MKKVIVIDGMSCAHCQAKAEQALNAIDGVEAKVNLKKKQAVVSLTAEVRDQVFQDALRKEGFAVVSIEEKKGLFS